MVAAKLAAPQTISNPASSSPHESSFRQAPGPGRTSSGSVATLRVEEAAALAASKASSVAEGVVESVVVFVFTGGYGSTGSIKVADHSFQVLSLTISFPSALTCLVFVYRGPFSLF